MSYTPLPLAVEAIEAGVWFGELFSFVEILEEREASPSLYDDESFSAELPLIT
jgi:hypothetical protein